MSTQHEVTTAQKLLNKSGNIAEPGYAKNMVWAYDRADITAKPVRVKEWDYYYVGNNDFGIALTIADNGYVGALSASVLDFNEATELTKTAISFFPLGKLEFPKTPDVGDSMHRIGNVWMEFRNDGKKRVLTGEYPKFGKNKETLSFHIELTDSPEEYMVIATPFDKDKHFYFNAKVNCQLASGSFSIGDKTCCLDNTNALGTLDWGRGVWTYDNTWYWGSGQTVLPSGDVFGFNIGYGFGNTSAATENMLFFNGTAHKLDEVTFNIPQKNGKDDYMSPWTFSSNDGRFEMKFTPILDRYAPLDLKVMCMIPHQVFGRMSGKAVLDDGRVVEIQDVVVFAEKVHNKW